ncbi:MAG: apolipoprotein N-acyltransferase [Desulfobacterales bacterium]
MRRSETTPELTEGASRPINRSKIFLAGTGGVLLTLAFPRSGLSLLAWVAFVPLLLAVRDVRPGTGFRLGLAWGLAHYLTLLYWIAYTLRTYGYLPWAAALPLLFLLCCYMSLYPAVCAWAVCRCCRHPILLLTGFPALYTALEYLRTFIFTGFPWGLLGYTQYRLLPVIQVADITGAYGVSYLVALVSAALTLLILSRSGKEWQERAVIGRLPRLAAGAAAALVLIAAGYGFWRMHAIDRQAADARNVKVAVVQGNIEQARKWDPAFQIASTKTYIDQSVGLKDRRPDLVVWPETATPFYLFGNESLTRMVQRGIRSTGSHFLVGSPAMRTEGDDVQLFNSAYILDPEGEPVGRYDKAHLVPYGEYVPLRNYMPFVGKMVAQIGDFTPGQAGKVLDGPGAPLGVLICYEVIFPSLSRRMAANGAGILANLTNDAWYGWTSAPFQHFSTAVFRAIENRRSLVRAANTGISGFIDPVGRILEASPLFVETALVQEVPVLEQTSLYTRGGDLFAWICLTGSLLLAVRCVVRNRRPRG